MAEAPGPIRVLYVDDDAALARLAQKTLGRAGFDVAHAADVAMARAVIAGGGVDAIALDHYLPSGTGLDFLAELAAGGDAPPVVYVTGSSETSVAVAALKAGAADFVAKTIGDDFFTLLRAALQQAIEQARLHAQKEKAERELRAAKERAETLLAEVNHRVANSLALVASLVAMQGRAAPEEAVRDALAETHARINAIALVHKRLYSSQDVRSVALDEYLASLLGHLQDSMREGHAGVRLAHQLDPISVATDAGVSLGVVATEWVTNAFKYAYPDRVGEVRVRLRRLDGGKAELAVEDDGVGRREGAAAQGTGLGTRIVRTIASSLGGAIEYGESAQGAAIRLVFPEQGVRGVAA